MSEMDKPRGRNRKRGAALGMLGLILLGFMVAFMLGRHSRIIAPAIAHFDPHPDGMSKRTHGGFLAYGYQMLQKTVFGDTDAGSNKAGSENLLGNQPDQVASLKQQTASKKDEVKQTTMAPVVKQDTKQAANCGSEDEECVTALDKQYILSREMVQRIAQDGYLMVTCASWHYQDFVRTWIYHVQHAGITGYFVGAMDDHLLKVLIDQKVNAFSMKSDLILGAYSWGSKSFAKANREKVQLIAVFLKMGVQVIVSDVDVLWLRNPIPFFQRYPDADILTSSDQLANTVPGEQLEKWPDAFPANIGIVLFREKSLKFVEHWIDVILKNQTVWDQDMFNVLFLMGAQKIKCNKQNLFLGYNGEVKMGILPVSLFCSGHTFMQKMHQKLNLQPYAFHTTYQFHGIHGKRHRMREAQLFDDPPKYYNHKVGFVTFQWDDELKALLAEAGPRTGQMDLANVQGHFKLVNWELVRIRNALAISSILGRALVVPPLWCGLDRWWGPHAGRIPGSNFDLPFQCPLDHVMDLEGGWAGQNLPPDIFGPNTEFREFSFLNNTRMSGAVRNSKVVVEICPPGTIGCSDGSAPAPVQDGRVRVQAGLLSEPLKTALQGAAKYKVLEFSTMTNAFNNFTNPADFTKFFNRLRGYTSIWCCVNAHPGHIHYDFWWDIPHIDKHNHAWTTWEPKTGP